MQASLTRLRSRDQTRWLIGKIADTFFWFLSFELENLSELVKKALEYVHWRKNFSVERALDIGDFLELLIPYFHFPLNMDQYKMKLEIHPIINKDFPVSFIF